MNYKNLISNLSLKEAKELPRIYCDMDGVLCDFESQAEKATGMPIGRWASLPKSAEKWKPVLKFPNFWSSMPWTRDGKTLWSFISKYNPHILSAYVEQTSDPNCIPGKRKWARTNLGISNTRINLVKRREKQNFATRGETFNTPAILIDDYIKNINQFKAKGGIGIHHTSTANTISQLKKLGYK